MLRMNRILLPIDFHETSKAVVHQAVILSRHFQSELIILHVLTPLSYSAGSLEGTYVPTSLADLKAELIRQAQHNLDRFLAPELEGLSVKRELLEGDPAHTIVETAGQQNVDLIMMPTHGYGAFRRFLIGSVTAKVLHDSECPVWTGAHLEAAPSREFAIGHVLCAVDLSPRSPGTIQWAAQLAAEFGARLTLCHVTPAAGPYGLGGYPIDPSWKEALVDFAMKDLAKLQQDLNIKANVIIESGDVPRRLHQAAKQVQADLLVVGRPSGGRLRPTGYGIIRESFVPVLSV